MPRCTMETLIDKVREILVQENTGIEVSAGFKDVSRLKKATCFNNR